MATSYSFKPIVTNGLVLCLDAANTKSFPGSGSTWSDLSGNGKNGTLIGTPTFNSSNGGGIVFNGSSQYVSTNMIFDPTSAITVSGWVKITNSSVGLSKAIISNHETPSQNGWALGKISTSNKMRFYAVGSSNLYVEETDDITVNEIVFYVGTYDKSNLRIYRNGIQKNSVSSSINFSASNRTVQIARWYDTINDYFWPGNIYSVSIYDRALTATEVLQNYNALKNRYI
jgi:hypothetical protein